MDLEDVQSPVEDSLGAINTIYCSGMHMEYLHF